MRIFRAGVAADDPGGLHLANGLESRPVRFHLQPIQLTTERITLDISTRPWSFSMVSWAAQHRTEDNYQNIMEFVEFVEFVARLAMRIGQVGEIGARVE